MPQSVDGQSIPRLDAPLHPTTEACDGCVAGSRIHTTAETRSSGPGTDPSMRRRRHDCEGTSSSPAMAVAVLCNRGLSHIDAELEQLIVYPRSAPKRVCDAHLADEAANIPWCRWPATARSGPPTPIGAETSAMPAQQRLRPNDLHRFQHPRSQSIEPNKQQSVDAPESHSFRRLAPQDVELMPKHKDFDLQRSPRPEQPDQGAPDQPAKIAHRSNYRPIRGRQSAVLGLR